MLFMARTFWHAFWGSLPADPGWGSFAGFREVRVEGPVLDIAKILAALPHRYPFLLVDRVVTVVKGERIHAYKNVTFNEGFFQGHFPGNPVMPGVLQLEALAQAGALLAHESAPFDPSQKVILLLAFDEVKFRRVVSPGDRLDLHVAIERQKESFWRLEGHAKEDGQLASEAEILAPIADRKQQQGATPPPRSTGTRSRVRPARSL